MLKIKNLHNEFIRPDLTLLPPLTCGLAFDIIAFIWQKNQKVALLSELLPRLHWPPLPKSPSSSRDPEFCFEGNSSPFAGCAAVRDRLRD